MDSPNSPSQSIKEEHDDLWTPSALAMPMFSLSPVEWPADWSVEDTATDSSETSKEAVDEMNAKIIRLEEEVQHLKRSVGRNFQEILN
jgi:hypothetical protein